MCSRLNNDISSATLLLQIIGRSLNNELEETWTQKVVTSIKVMFRNLLGDVMKTLTNISYDNQHPGRVTNPGPSVHEARVLATGLRLPVEIS
jgi:hypothetical protein